MNIAEKNEKLLLEESLLNNKKEKLDNQEYETKRKGDGFFLPLATVLGA